MITTVIVIPFCSLIGKLLIGYADERGVAEDNNSSYLPVAATTTITTTTTDRDGFAKPIPRVPLVMAQGTTTLGGGGGADTDEDELL